MSKINVVALKAKYFPRIQLKLKLHKYIVFFYVYKKKYENKYLTQIYITNITTINITSKTAREKKTLKSRFFNFSRDVLGALLYTIPAAI